MRIIVIAGAVALLGVLLVAFYLRARPAVAEPESAAGDPAEASAALRASLLNGSASEFSIEPISSIWGVLMETGYPEAAATVVSLADGSASIYFSSGGGTIGGGSHDTVAAASRRVVILSKSHLSSMAKTSQYPLRKPGHVKFYVLTTNGVFTTEEVEETLGAGDHSLSPLFYASHDVITALRQAREAGEEAAGRAIARREQPYNKAMKSDVE
ncbi:MAG: hypothetical protein QF890_02370, partial [Myxococcota bacterium]|nr:hypothetical protein [Myxococcota bacterium]